MLFDSLGRQAEKLRISVTDKCNFACLFCMPDKDKVKFIPEKEILNFDEIERVTRILVSLGIKKIRITGGEPLLRKDLDKLIARLHQIEGIVSIDMTTNGWYLEEMANRLKEAGLGGVTVSLHSLKKEKFEMISGVNALSRVMKGIEKARDVGLHPLKINTVAIKGYNDDEIPELIDYAIKVNASIRFIEFMPLDGLGIWNENMVMTGKEIIEIVKKYYSVHPNGRGTGETSSSWIIDGKFKIGLITPISEPFCDDCDRIRLTSDGKLLSCLFDTNYYDLKSLLRNGASNQEIAKFIISSVWKKPAGIAYMPWIKNGWERPRSMNAIGG